MSFQRYLWTLVAVAVIAAYGIASGRESDAADAPSATALAAFLGCPPAEPKHATGTRETVACEEGGFDVTVVTFDDNAQRDAWVESERLTVIASGFAGLPAALVAGDRWAVTTGDVPAADRLHAVAGGWRV
ncbi:hypothetical protein ACQEVZ_12850 [Dactylosporangium sp. CA-152071]|uniref:hypothetical protein n=1 Tax=Dactylosporangium sp. CA-152071 TaxID=3239933 RepID=UPI003D8AB993